MTRRIRKNGRDIQNRLLHRYNPGTMFLKLSCLRLSLIAIVVTGCQSRQEPSERHSSTPMTHATVAPAIRMIAFRTGGRLGDAIDEATQKKKDPTDYVVLV